MDCSVIIVNYNTKKLTISCIDSIATHTEGLTYEILVVDNASTDGSQKDIKRMFPEVFLIESEENLGFGRANNLGASKAKGKYLFFLNSDTLFLNNAIKIFYDYFENTQFLNLGCIGCNLVDADLKINGNGGRFPEIKYYLINRIKAVIYKIARNKKENQFSSKVDYVLGADMFIPSVAFREVNGFDERFFMYFEEADLQLKFFKLGYQSKIIEGPQIIHLEGKSTQNSIKKVIMVQESAFKYYCYNRPFWEYLLLRIISLVEALTFILKRGVSFQDFIVYLKFNLNIRNK